MAISAAARAGAPPAISSNWRRDAYYPDSLGDLYGRVTELLGFNAGADEHKVQWLSTADSRRALPAAVRRNPRQRRLAVPQSQLLRRRPPEPAAASARNSTRASASRTARRFPSSMHAPLAAGLQRAVERVVLRMAGTGENLCLAGGLFFNALLISSLEAVRRTSSCSPRPATPEPRSARCSTPGTASVGQTEARLAERSLPRPQLHRRRDQAGAGKLQAALPLSADHRRAARPRRARA